MTVEPTASRASLPDGYGLPEESVLLEWSGVSGRLAAAKQYWIGTVDGDGAPNPRPIDGLWVEDKLYFGGDPKSRWQRNIRTNRTVSLNLENANRAVIVQGVVSAERPDRALAMKLVTHSNEKYDMGQKLGEYENQVIGVLTPEVVLAWDTLYEDATRFQFKN